MRSSMHSTFVLALFAIVAGTSTSASEEPTSVQPRYPDLVVPPGTTESVRIDMGHVRYKGSTYAINRKNEPSQIPAAVRDSVTKVLSDSDFIPFSRLEHFAWCNRPDLAVVGWSGHIESFEVTSQGLLVRVSVGPQLDRGEAAAVATLDRYREYYLFDSRLRFHFLGGEPSGHFRGSVFGF